VKKKKEEEEKPKKSFLPCRLLNAYCMNSLKKKKEKWSGVRSAE